MRVSDLRKPLPDGVKYAVLARQAVCWLCEEPLAGSPVFCAMTVIHDPPRALHDSCIEYSFRDPVKLKIKNKIAILTEQCKCQGCGFRLHKGKVRFDHRPPLEQRKLNRAKTDFIPKQHNPLFIDALDIECHQFRTTGRKPGALKTVTTLGSDVHIAAKLRRMLRRGKKPKRKWPKRALKSRPFRKR